MSALGGLLTNKQLKKDPSKRWFKYFIDFSLTKQDYASLSIHLNSWSKAFNFTKTNRLKVPKVPGIYLFYVKPDVQIHVEQSYILYIGYSMNLYNRYGDYLNTYKNSDEPNYIERRIMLNVWEEDLYYTFIELTKLTEVEIQAIEEKMIDATVPPVNRKFVNAVIKQQVRLYRKH